MIQIFKILFIIAGSVVGLVLFGLSCLVLMLFPEWVRWIAGGLTAIFVGWFVFFGRFRKKAGLLINDGTVYDRWRPRSNVRRDFL